MSEAKLTVKFYSLKTSFKVVARVYARVDTRVNGWMDRTSTLKLPMLMQV